jgi:hypothetical protein
MGEIGFRPRDFPLAQNLRSVEIRGPIVGLKKDEQIQRLKIFWANFRSTLGHAGLNMGKVGQPLHLLDVSGLTPNLTRTWPKITPICLRKNLVGC